MSARGNVYQRDDGSLWMATDVHVWVCLAPLERRGRTEILGRGDGMRGVRVVIQVEPVKP